jgi:PAS domain S-box-containing protein
MWDIATPIMVGGQHIGNIFSGQFFFEDEFLDYEFFRVQARKYGFNEEEYMAALEKVPWLSKEAVEIGMTFLTKLAHMISQLSYSNSRLAYSLVERDSLVGALRESEKREKARSYELGAVLDAVPAAVWIAHDPGALTMTGNRLSYEWLRLPEGANMSKAAPEERRSETYKLCRNGFEIPISDMPLRMAASGKELSNYEFDLVYPDGTMRHLLGNAKPLRDEQGSPHGSISAFIDITERKKAEASLKKAYDNLEEKVKERTAQLEKAFNSLKESEKGLAEAQKMAHIGNWEWDIAADKAYWSEEMYRIFGRDPRKEAPSYNEYLRYIHPDDLNRYCDAIKQAVKGKTFGIDYRIVLGNGEQRVVYLRSEFVSDNEGVPVLIKGIVQDITERKKAENTLANLEIARKKEIHHRIKNNLQVISSLLDLQAEKFRDKEVLKAFRESQDRILSMSLIHEELYKGEGTDTLNFSEYLQKLAKNLFQTYNLRSKNLHLLMELEENALFNMDTAIPLGIIVNELVSNSLKYAFIEGEDGEIRIQLCREEKSNKRHESLFSLTISDNGTGIPENIELESLESLGLQLVSILVNQLDGNIELERERGTKFRILFNAVELQ